MDTGKQAAMGYENDLPPKSPERTDDFLGSLGWVVVRFLPVALFFLVAALALYAGMHWLH